MKKQKCTPKTIKRKIKATTAKTITHTLTQQKNSKETTNKNLTKKTKAKSIVNILYYKKG